MRLATENDVLTMEDNVEIIDEMRFYTVYQDELPVYKTSNRDEAEAYWDKVKKPGIHTYIKTSEGFYIIDTEDLPF